MDYALHTGVLIAVYGVLALGQSFLFGLGNVLFVTQGAALGIGAYTWAILVGYSVPPEIALGIALLSAALILVPLAIPTLRLTGDYLLVASLALCEVVRSFLNNAPELTGGAQGLSVPLLKLGPFQFASTGDHLFLAGGLLVFFAVCFLLLARSPYGRLLRATGEDAELLTGEDAMRALGKPVRRVRATAVAMAAMSAGLIGAIYASYMTYLDPTQFTLWDSVLVLTMVVLGGLGTIRGAVAGGTIFVVVPEILRFVEISSGAAGPLRQVLFGLLLLLVLRFRPAGLFGRKDLAWLRA